jgi:hypothetical protein
LRQGGRRCVKVVGIPDIVVNNAIAYKSRPMIEVDDDSFGRIFATNR